MPYSIHGCECSVRMHGMRFLHGLFTQYASFICLLAQRCYLLHDGVVEIRNLRSFLTVAEKGGITAAARCLGLSQSALSRQVKALEDELGVSLLERGARSFTLTPAAEMLWERGRELLRQHDSLVEEMRDSAARKPLRIGYSPSLASSFLSVAIQNYAQRHPSPRISLRELSSLEMVRMLGQGELEVILALPIPSTDPIEWTCLREHSWKVIVGAGHRWFGQPDVEIADLADEPLLIYDRNDYPDYWSRISVYFRSRKLSPRVACEFDGITSLTAAVEANLGVALVAESTQMIRGEPRKVRALDLDPQPDPLRVSVGVQGRYTPPPHVRAFVEELKIAVDLDP